MTSVDNRPLRVFLCHAKEDKPTVRDLYRQLTAEGWLDVWLDEINLLPGQEWDMEIEKAVEQADVVIVCLSNKSVAKEGYVQKELRFVLNIADEKPEGAIFVIPLRLDDCQVPRRIRAWQYVDYFPKNNQAWAYQRLIESLKLRARKLGISVVSEKARQEKISLEKAEAERNNIEAEVGKAIDYVVKESAKDFERQKKKHQREVLWKRSVVPVLVITTILVLAGFSMNYLLGLNTANDTPTETLTIPNVTVTSKVTVTLPTSNDTQIPLTETPEPPTITPEPTLGIGSTKISEKDGMVMMYVPAGEFIMGSNGGRNDEKPVHSVYLDAYYIDKYEVTNSAYKRCVDAGKCYPPKESNSYKHSLYYGNSEFDDYPVIYVDWNRAKTYCEWRDARLPTEAEWEKAARGTDGGTYPWGEGTSCFFANYRDHDNNCIIDEVTKVGSYERGKSPYGLYDMAGNVLEWVLDWHDTTYYQSSPSANPLGPVTGMYHVLRGGSWILQGSHSVSTAARYTIATISNVPTNFRFDIGFRCAKSAP